MKNQVSRLRCTLLLAMTLTSLGAWSHTFTIHQISWGSDTGGYLVQNSEWGTANIQFGPGDESEFVFTPAGYIGYVQVVTAVAAGGPYNWAVQNMPLIFPSASDFDGRLPDSFNFNLGLPRGENLTLDHDFRGAVLITPHPLTSMPYVPLFLEQYVVPVTAEDWLWGNGLAGEVAPSTAENFVAFADDANEKTEAKIKIEETDVEAIDEEINGCGPGGAARSLRYLAKQKLITLNQTGQQVYDTLKGKAFMNTGLGVKGTGTTDANFQKGKDAYSKARNLKVVTDGTFTAAVLQTDIMNPMNQGGDVEIVFKKGKNDQGQDQLGHIAFVSQILLTSDKKTGNVTSFKVRYIDDPKQGDSKAENEAHWLEFDVTYDNQMKETITLKGWGPGATLDQFFLEKVSK